MRRDEYRYEFAISTHSRAKAAGAAFHVRPPHQWNFNSQPREGGWLTSSVGMPAFQHFNSQPREGGWSRPKAAEQHKTYFNSQPREGGWTAILAQANPASPFQLTAARRRLGIGLRVLFVDSTISTHSRAKAAGKIDVHFYAEDGISTHSRAKAAG